MMPTANDDPELQAQLARMAQNLRDYGHKNVKDIRAEVEQDAVSAGLAAQGADPAAKQAADLAQYLKEHGGPPASLLGNMLDDQLGVRGARMKASYAQDESELEMGLEAALAGEDVTLYPMSRADLGRLLNNFTYHPPKNDQTRRYEIVRDMARSLAYLWQHLCPPSRELSLALTHLEEAVMWANAAIARNE